MRLYDIWQLEDELKVIIAHGGDISRAKKIQQLLSEAESGGVQLPQ